MDDIISAIHWWCTERPNLKPTVKPLLLFTFDTLHRLHETVKNLPIDYTPQKDGFIGKRNYIINFQKNSSSYNIIRLTLAFISDLYFSLETLMKQGNLMEIQQDIALMGQKARCFDDIRNFFTHMDERLFLLDRHGISGTGNVDGVQYKKSKENFYLRVAEGVVYFSDYGQLKKTILTTRAFIPIFDDATKLYSKLISHKINSQFCNYPLANTIFCL